MTVSNHATARVPASEPEFAVDADPEINGDLHADTPRPVTPLKIALLGYRSHPYVGGQGIYLTYLSRALAQLGHEVHVYSGPPYPKLDKQIPLIKIPSLDLYASSNHIRALRWKHLKSFTDFFEWWTMATGGFGEPYTFGRRIFKRLQHSSYDVIHDNQSLCFGLLKLQKAGHRVVSTIHHPIHRDRELALASAPNRGMRILIRRWHSFLGMQEKVTAQLHHVVTVSRQSQQDIAHYFKRDATRTPIFFNGVDTDLFQPLANRQKHTCTLLTTSSSDQALKGLDSVLIALDKLRTVFPSIKLNVIGRLKSGGKNEKLIRTLNLNKHVFFYSGIDNRELVKKYNEATVVVCPSRYEGFGLPAAEALACGTAVVSSDGGALPEVVGDAGLVYTAGDSDALYSALQRVLNDEVLRQNLEKRGRARAVSYFCWQRVAEQLSGYYERMSAG